MPAAGSYGAACALVCMGAAAAPVRVAATGIETAKEPVMAMRTIAFASLLLLLAACETPPPVQVQPTFETSAALAAVNPADIAVLPVEDGTAGGRASYLLESMRQVLMRGLTEKLYSPLRPSLVDAAVKAEPRSAAESALTPGYLKRIAGKATEDGVLAVRISQWDETPLLTDKKVRFQIEAVLASGNGGEVLWKGSLTGEAKAGGLGAAPRDREAMARSCAELAMLELLNHLRPRTL